MNIIEKESEQNLEQEIVEIYKSLTSITNIPFKQFSSKTYTKGIIFCSNKFINKYINLASKRKNRISSYINFLKYKFIKMPSDNFKKANKENIKKVVLLIYISLFRYQVSISLNKNIESSHKYLIFTKLHKFLKIMSSTIGKLFFTKIIDISELGAILKMLIIFSMNNTFKELKENNDIKNMMYFKECLNIIYIIFSKTSNKDEQIFLIDIFKYICNNICFRDKLNNNLNYTNKFFMLHNDWKTTKLIKLLTLIHKINNNDLTEVYLGFLSNIYYFQFGYNNLTWQLYELLQPLLENIQEKNYDVILNEVSFPEFQLNFIKNLIKKERIFIKDNNLIFKNAFYFSGNQQNSGIIADIGKMQSHFLLAFGFNLIITNEIIDEYIIFLIKNYDQKVILKAAILKSEDGYFFSIIDSRLNKDGRCWTMKINPGHYYTFSMLVEKGKNISMSFFKNNTIIEEKFKIKDLKSSNSILCVGCDVEKIDPKSNAIHKNYKFINKFTGFIGDIFIINLHSYKEKFPLNKNILNLKGKYGYTLIKSIWEQKSLNEHLTSYLEKTSKVIVDNDEEPNIFKTKFSLKKQFKILENIEVYVNSYNFNLVEYMDNIDYMNYENKYHLKEKLITKIKKENQYYNNLRTNETNFDTKIIEIGTSLFNCNFNIFENTSGLLKFVEEDGIFYFLLILEYYYQIIFKICKDVLGEDKKDFALSEEHKAILRNIEFGIKEIMEFFFKKIIETNFNIKFYKIILFYYQMNVTIKQFLLLKNINDDIYQLLIKFFDRYQKSLRDYIKTNFIEEKDFYKNQRNFFFDFLLNPSFYHQADDFNLINNLSKFFDSSFKVIQDNFINDEIYSEYIFTKIFNLDFILKKEDEKKEDKIISYKVVKQKYLFFILILLEAIYNSPNKILFNFYLAKLFEYQRDPIIFYNLSLVIFASKTIYEFQDDFINKIIKVFENNYNEKNIENRILSISSMILITYYYFISKPNDIEFKKFKDWFSQLNQKNAIIYFENICNIIAGGVFDINIILDMSKNFAINMNEADLLKKKFFEQREKEMNSPPPLITILISQNIFIPLARISGCENLRKKSSVKELTPQGANIDENIDNLDEIAAINLEESKKRKGTIQKLNIKINFKANFEINEQEIKKIKNHLHEQKYYNTYFTFLDDIKRRCFIYNPKNILIKRFFSHIFYKSLYHCNAFMYIKNIYLNTFKEANIGNKQLNYPSKLKNFSNLYEPKFFLKKDFAFYKKTFFGVMHDNLTKNPPDYEEINDKKIEKLNKLLESKVSDINFYEHHLNINEILEEKERYFDCELITQQFTFYGYLILGDFYIYFGTKFDKPIDLRDKKIEEVDINYISRFCFSNRDKDNETTKTKNIILFYQDIQRITRRRSFLMYQSFEVFCQNGKSYFFNLYRKENCDNVFKILTSIKESLSNKDRFEFLNENISEEVKKASNEVKSGAINNFTYLLRLNYYSSRTFNDLNQYPIYPWLFFDLTKIESLLAIDKNSIGQIETIPELASFSEPDIDIIEPEKIEPKGKKESNEDLTRKYSLRNFTYPIGLQREEKRDMYIENGYIPHGTHYSTASYLFYYLVRNNPFTESMVQLQHLTKESPNRLFISLDGSLKILYENIENREIIPDFFCHFDFYSNLNCGFFGITQSGDLVDDLAVDKWYDFSKNLYSVYCRYTYLFRKFLNSYLISKFLPNWIDFIFGSKQSEKSSTSFYNFNEVSYEDKLKLDKELASMTKQCQNGEITNKELRKELNIKIDMLNNFGITPRKIVNSTVKLKTSAKIKNLSDEVLEIGQNYYFIKCNENILILYKNAKDSKDLDRTKKILFWNYRNKNTKIFDKKNIFTCGYLKRLEKVTMKDNSKIPIFKPCYSMTKFYLFNKIFIATCRYLGNIFKIQNNEYFIDVFCEDFVSCITNKKALGSNAEDVIIYTGLKNGKLIEWYINQNLNDYGKINIKERNSIHCHKGEITCIEIYTNQNVLLTGGEDKMIFIRKTYDFELLTAINLVYCYMNPIISEKINIVPTLIKISDLNCIYVVLHNYDTGKSFIRGYNLNGLFFKQTEEDYFMNICFTKNCNLLVSYYNQKEIRVLNCYDFEFTDFFLYIPKFVENIEKSMRKSKKKKDNENFGNLVWNYYDYKNHELILLFKNKIVRGNIKDKEEQINLEFY